MVLVQRNLFSFLKKKFLESDTLSTGIPEPQKTAIVSHIKPFNQETTFRIPFTENAITISGVSCTLGTFSDSDLLKRGDFIFKKQEDGSYAIKHI